nr:hypothetical protein [Tanacetum cinerariifolium]
MSIMVGNVIAAGADNRPPMLKKMAESYAGTPTLSASTRPRTYDDLTDKEKIHEECDIRAFNIVLQGLPPNVYTLVNHYTVAKEIWDKVKLLIERIELSLQEQESKLYNEFDQFTSEEG